MSCIQLTKKNLPCKNKPLKGLKTCRIHSPTYPYTCNLCEDNTERKPLDCSHVLCYTCVDNLIYEVCPFCRKHIDLNLFSYTKMLSRRKKYLEDRLKEEEATIFYYSISKEPHLRLLSILTNDIYKSDNPFDKEVMRLYKIDQEEISNKYSILLLELTSEQQVLRLFELFFSPQITA